MSGFWLEMLIGLAVITVLLVLIGPGLWSSRVDIHKPDDPNDKKPKADR